MNDLSKLFKQSIEKYAPAVQQTPTFRPLDIQPDKDASNQNTVDIKADKTADISSDEEPAKKSEKNIRDDPEKNSRTMFVGNLSVTVLQKSGTKAFKQFLRQFTDGKIESIRFRSIALNKPIKDKKMRKIGILREKDIHEQCESINAYVVFKSKDDMKQCAEKMNGQIFQNLHVRCDFADHKKPFEPKRTIFIGNLPLNISEELLWRHFEKNCGQVEGVRVVKDAATNLGKGIAYVCFKEQSSVSIALQMNETNCPLRPTDTAKPRSMRITTCVRKVKESKKRVGNNSEVKAYTKRKFGNSGAKQNKKNQQN